MTYVADRWHSLRMTIRVKIRERKAKGRGGETWDFRVVESRRVAGTATPRQRTVVFLGSLRNEGRVGVDPQREAAEFRTACLRKMKAAGVAPSARMLDKLDSLLAKRCTACPPAPVGVAEFVSSIATAFRAERPAPFRKTGSRPAAPAISFKGWGAKAPR